MVRRYPVKGKKRKHRERYDEDAEEEQEQEKRMKVEADEPRETEVDDGQEQPEEAEEKVADVLQGLPVVPMETKRDMSPGIVFVLEKASLEVAKVGKSYQLLNSDDHANFLKRNGRNPAEYRPDIIHQALLSILDSPLNKAGKVRAVYVKTERGVLFEVKPHVRIPRTYKRFSGIMLQLLQKLSINAAGKREKLLRVIKNPVTQYLPINSKRIGFSHSSMKVVEMQDYVASISDDTTLVFVVGAMAHGKIETDYTDDFISKDPKKVCCYCACPLEWVFNVASGFSKPCRTFTNCSNCHTLTHRILTHWSHSITQNTAHYIVLCWIHLDLRIPNLVRQLHNIISGDLCT